MGICKSNSLGYHAETNRARQENQMVNEEKTKQKTAKKKPIALKINCSWAFQGFPVHGFRVCERWQQWIVSDRCLRWRLDTDTRECCRAFCHSRISRSLCRRFYIILTLLFCYFHFYIFSSAILVVIWKFKCITLHLIRFWFLCF